MPTPPPPEGRRARKRRETEFNLVHAALDLALAVGYDNVTIDAICARADVSRSTFFNYFPSRDTAIIGRSLPEFTDEQVAAAFGAAPGDLVAGLLRISIPNLDTASVPDNTISEMRARLLAEQPAAVTHYSAALVASQEHLTDAALRWLSAHPEQARLDDPVREAILAVTGAYAIMFAASNGWSRAFTTVDDPFALLAQRRGDLITLIGRSA